MLGIIIGTDNGGTLDAQIGSQITKIGEYMVENKDFYGLASERIPAQGSEGAIFKAFFDAH